MLWPNGDPAYNVINVIIRKRFMDRYGKCLGATCKQKMKRGEVRLAGKKVGIVAGKGGAYGFVVHAVPHTGITVEAGGGGDK